MRRTLFRLFACILGLAAGALVVFVVLRSWPGPTEVSPEHYEALRARLDYNPRSLYRFDPDLSYLFKPSFVGIRRGSADFPHHTNSRSLLSTKEVPTGGDAKRVLFLGDSVTYGDRVRFEEIFTSRLKERAGDGWFVANGSCPGWSTHQEVGFYRKYLSDLDWDAVVLVVSLNDLVKFEWVYGTDSEFRLSAEVEQSGGLGPISSSVNGLRLLALRSKFAADPRTAPLADHNIAALFAWDDTKWEEYEKDVLRPAVGEGGIPNLVVVAMPSLLQLAASARGAPDEIVWKPQRRFKIACRDTEFIDARAALVGDAKPDALFLDNLHLSAAGHERVAEFLWPEIRAAVER